LFGFGGTTKTRGQLAKEEFGVGFDHMMQAATHAAGGVGSTMGPRMHGMRSMITPASGRVRTAASSGWDSTVSSLAPLMAAAREGAREATEVAIKTRAKAANRRKREKQVKQRRIGMALGFLAAGVAVGAAAALVVRRRRRNAWEDYDPSEALESMMDSVGDRVSDVKGTASGMKDKAMDKAGDMQDKAGEMKDKTADSTMARSGESAQEADALANDMNSKARRS
jgi:hypothetical protein